jgi:DNA ligase D-like protein (predicted 3'-phosphoesterase)
MPAKATAKATSSKRRRRAIRAQLTSSSFKGDPRETIRDRARELGLHGWVRENADKVLEVHAEGAASAAEQLTSLLDELSRPVPPTVDDARVEGHEQFAIRGVSAGAFVVREHAASTRHFDMRLQVGGAMRSWALPRGPSLDPAVKRLAVQVPDHALERGDRDGDRVIVWDRGVYEQGGRVPWPQALERGHAVFVLHGEKLRGGFALQRTRGGEKPQWLLIKRRDEDARPGSDVVAEARASVVTGRTLDELLEDA